MNAEIIGWLGAALLTATISKQVYKQWKDHSAAGVSHWLFIGQFASSLAFTTYSVIKGDAVFIFTNALMLTIAVLGFFIDRRNRASQEKSPLP